MPLDNPLEIYKLLPKTNCKLCKAPTCLAFAAAVIKGEKRLEECLQLESGKLKELEGKIIRQMSPEEQLKQVLEPLQKKIVGIDFRTAEQRLGATLAGDKLKIKCLGKDFVVGPQGTIVSDCHINVWVTAPILNYIICCAGNEPCGKWVPFRELSQETVWDSFFVQRFEKPLKQLTDANPELIEDIISVFSGKPVANLFSSDISLVLQPLPKLPLLICYTKPTEDIESKLNVFFDSTAAANLNIESIYRLCVGLLVMFQKITARHVRP